MYWGSSADNQCGKGECLETAFNTVVLPLCNCVNNELSHFKLLWVCPANSKARDNMLVIPN